MLRVGICGWQRAQDEVLEAVNLMEVQRTFYQPPRSGGPRYHRLHGRPAEERNYGYTYTDGDLEKLLEELEGAGEAWVLFNNHTMIQDARRFRELARERGFDAR